MASTPRNRLRQTPTDIWSGREKLALACAVMRSGDLNWVSVSRAARPFAETGRPSEWFSQKNCALQYSDLLDKVETPKRKRGEREVLEAPGDIIVRKLTIERIEELKRVVQEQQNRYKKLKREVELVQSGQADEKLKEIWAEIQKRKVAEEKAGRKSTETTPVASEQAKAAQKLKRPSPGLKLNISEALSAASNTQESNAASADSATTEAVSASTSGGVAPSEDKPITSPPPSALLNSLLKDTNALQSALQKQEERTQQIRAEVTELEKESLHVVKVQQGGAPQVVEQPAPNPAQDTEVKVEPADVSDINPIETPEVEIKEEVVVDSDAEVTLNLKTEQEGAGTTEEAEKANISPPEDTPATELPQKVPEKKPESNLDVEKEDYSSKLGEKPAANKSEENLKSTNEKQEPQKSEQKDTKTKPGQKSKSPKVQNAEKSPAAKSLFVKEEDEKKKKETPKSEAKPSEDIPESERSPPWATVKPSKKTTPKSTPSKPTTEQETSPKWCSVKPSKSKVEECPKTPESTIALTDYTPRRISIRNLSRRLSKGLPPEDLQPTKPARTPSASAKDKKIKYYEPEAPATPEPSEDVSALSRRVSPDFEDQPLSPASSTVSNETDSGSVRGRGRRSRGGKAKAGGRKSGRITRTRIMEEDKKESETSSKPSEAESSDDEDEDSVLPMEGDDTMNSSSFKGLPGLESTPNSPASVNFGDTEDEKAHKVWKKSIMLVWNAAAHHKYANVFRHPVTDDIAPGYSSVVSRPMDLSTIKRHVDMGVIRTTSEFQRDMMLMFTNAIMYNNSDHDVFHMATQMYDDVMVHIEQFVNTEMMVQAEPKILRASRRSETVHSDKEDDGKKKRSSSTDQEQHTGGKAKKRRQ